jgi:ADP-ribose pyrophosphatase
MENSHNFDKENDVQILTQKYAYQGFYNIKEYELKHRLFNGQWSKVLKRELFDRPPVAAALPYDPVQNKVILIEQFRVGALEYCCPWLIEIVAGLADEKTANTEQLITRELQEESGIIAQALHKIYEFWVSPGGSNEYLTLYCAKVAAPMTGGIHGLAEENEDILVYVLDTEQALAMLTTGKITNATTIIALQWLALHKNDVDKIWT